MIPLFDTLPSRGVPIVTWILIGLNSLAFFYELSLTPRELEVFLRLVGMVPAQIAADPTALWTMLTSMFFHGGWLHFLGNMWTLYLFGDNVEDRLGPVHYLLFYLLCGLAAGWAQFAAQPDSPLPAIGASGAIAGVLGAYFAMFPTARVITLVPVFFVPLFFEVPAVVYLGVWFLTQLFSGVLSLGGAPQIGGVAWWAHIGGFVAGLLLLPVMKLPAAQYRDYHADEYWPW
jgi:membrane associated rhomboid family serine protease